MARIDRILMLDHPGPLRRFVWPNDPPQLANFERYNLVYGLNGSGKTSISRVLRGLEHDSMPSNCSVELEVNGRRIHSADIAAAAIAIRVFNTDFVTSSVIAAGRDGVPPIFVFGADSVNLQSDIDDLRITLDTMRARRDSTSLKQNAVDRELDTLRRQEARRIKQQLSSAGHNRYNNYNKSHYRTTAERLSSSSGKQHQRLTDQERRSLIAHSLSLPKSTIEPVSNGSPSIAVLAKGVDQILRTSVVSSVIRELEADPSVGSWVFTGLGLHSSRASELCLFCGQQLPPGRVGQLESHFNSAYIDLSRAIDTEVESLRRMTARIEGLPIPGREAFYESLEDDATNSIKALRRARARFRGTVEDLLQGLGDKKDRMFESYGVSLDADDDMATAIAALNKLIAKHNATSRQFDKAINTARARLEEGIVVESLPRYRQLKRESGVAVRALEHLEAEIGKITSEIRHKEEAILEHRRPAEELNNELQLYLGHGELQFDVKDTGYEITRDGVHAESLSEGEKTAIALLYFLKSLTSRHFNLSDGVVVLDDPVSSLDAGALFAAVGFIRDRTKGVGQLFVFTHNFTFFREMRRWLEGEARSSDSSLYMLETTFEQGRRLTNLRSLDPLLRDYESDYHYLFSQIYWYVHAGGSGDLQQNYVLPNMARRLLERFFAFCRPLKPGRSTLENQLEAAEVPAPMRTRITRFTHVHSHADSIDEPAHDVHVLAEAPEVLRDILEVMKQEAPVHFGQMEKLVRRSRSRETNK